jgi:hypothetical protein
MERPQEAITNLHDSQQPRPRAIVQSGSTCNSTRCSQAIVTLVEKFQLFASDAIASGDPSELHNAAMIAARQWKVRGPTMRRVLAAIACEYPDFRETVLGWKDSDATNVD